MTSSGFLGEASTFGAPAQFVGRRTGVAFGIDMRIDLTKRLAARTAMSYVQQGGVVDRVRPGPADGLIDETAIYQLDYFAIPLLAELRLPDHTILGLRPSLYLGPELSLQVPNLVGEVVENRPTQDKGTYYTQATSPVVSVVTGVEIAYPFPTGEEVALSVRYHYGLTDVTGAQEANARLGTIHAGLIIRYAR